MTPYIKTSKIFSLLYQKIPERFLRHVFDDLENYSFTRTLNFLTTFFFHYLLSCKSYFWAILLTKKYT